MYKTVEIAVVVVVVLVVVLLLLLCCCCCCVVVVVLLLLCCCVVVLLCCCCCCCVVVVVVVVVGCYLNVQLQRDRPYIWVKVEQTSCSHAKPLGNILQQTKERVHQSVFLYKGPYKHTNHLLQLKLSQY